MVQPHLLAIAHYKFRKALLSSFSKKGSRATPLF
nr:MAG TPA: hypothetical protein [Caudoviricetes sp.]